MVRETGAPTVCWNHNTAYHRLIVRAAAGHAGEVLDVGCGDGLLVSRLAPVSRRVTGVDADPAALAAAGRRTAGAGNITLLSGDFASVRLPPGGYDLITFVAVLHHVDLEPALVKARKLLKPGGSLLVIGLTRNGSVRDWVLSGLCLPVVRVSDWLHRGAGPNVVIAEPRETLAQIRSAAAKLLPGARVRRRLYYRYSLEWIKPA